MADFVADGGSLKIPSLNEGIGGSSNKELMADARSALDGNWGMAVLGYVLYFILMMSFTTFLFAGAFFVGVIGASSGTDTTSATSSMQFVVQVVEMLVSGAFMVGLCSFYLVIAQESEGRLEALFTGFRRFWKSFGAYFFYTLFIILWTFLFIIPGIIAFYRYAMVFFIIADDEDCGALEAIRRSKEMMKGNKWKYFCLNWRFFWWGLLCAIFPIGMLWLLPYMQTSFAKFYEDVK